MASSPLTSLRTNGNDIEIIDQLLLPHTQKWISINSIEDAHVAIRSMQIRGAPAIASLAALSIAQDLSRALTDSRHHVFLESIDALQDYIKPNLDFLFTARPTAVNLGQAMGRLRRLLEERVAAAKGQEQSGESVKQTVEVLIKEARAVADEDVGRNKLMSKHGAEWLLGDIKANGRELVNDKVNVLTVCNTGSLATSGYGTALGLITHLLETGNLNKAYYTQTAPYHQGSRLTSLELISLGAPSVMICDTMVGSLFQHHNIHAVVVGADRVAKNGDTANKIGTYNAAVLAARHKIPFIVVAPITTIDLDIADGTHIPIEQRPAIEACLARGAVHPQPKDVDSTSPAQSVVMITPANIDLEGGVYNPSFDVTPAELITAIVTEKGVAVKQSGAEAFDLSYII